MKNGINPDMHSYNNNTHDQLERQSRLLQGLNHMAGTLADMRANEFEPKFKAALQVIGRAAEADRVYLWRDTGDSGPAVFSKISEWTTDADLAANDVLVHTILSGRLTPEAGAGGYSP